MSSPGVKIISDHMIKLSEPTIVRLKEGDPEYRIAKRMGYSSGTSKLNRIINVYKVNNPRLLRKFCKSSARAKKHLYVHGFHGTEDYNKDSISRHGFKVGPRAMHGPGIYMAGDVNTSLTYSGTSNIVFVCVTDLISPNSEGSDASRAAMIRFPNDTKFYVNPNPSLVLPVYILEFN